MGNTNAGRWPYGARVRRSTPEENSTVLTRVKRQYNYGYPGAWQPQPQPPQQPPQRQPPTWGLPPSLLPPSQPHSKPYQSMGPQPPVPMRGRQGGHMGANPGSEVKSPEKLVKWAGQLSHQVSQRHCSKL